VSSSPTEDLYGDTPIGQPAAALEISVVLPAHNEAELLERSVREVTEGLRSRNRRFEVIVVENGSTDDTVGIARRLSGEFPEVRALTLCEADYGRALRAGLLAATGGVVVNFDVDWCDLGFLDRAVPLVEQPGGPAVVVGSKRTSGSDDTRVFARRMVTTVFFIALRVGFGLRVSDTHGVKAMRRSLLSPLAEQCRFGQDLFDTELILRAERAGLGSAEISVEVVELRPARSSILRRVPRTVIGLGRLRVAFWEETLRPKLPWRQGRRVLR
jgi:glycosyltransferase involved in cell wall biosynthesis